jgi:hypothetical protein
MGAGAAGSDAVAGRRAPSSHPIPRHPGDPVENVALYVFCRLESGEVVAATNTRNRLDSLPDTEVAFVPSDDPASLPPALDHLLRRHPADPPRIFRGGDELTAFIDARSEKQLREKLARGYYLPMSDAEVETAKTQYDQVRRSRQAT